MKTLSTIFTIAFLAFISIHLQGQVESNKEKLLQFSETKTAEFNQKKAEAVEYARQNNLPMIIETDSTFMELMFIDDSGMPQYYVTSNANSAKTISTNKVHPGGGYGFSLDGSGLTVHEWDAGAVLSTHQEFGSRVTQVDGATYTDYHSTHVAGTVIALGVDPLAKGMAPNANLRAFDWNNDEAEMASEAASGALVSNHSYGFVRGWETFFGEPYWFGTPAISILEDYLFGFYDAYAQGWDQIAHDAPYYLIVIAAGNDRDDDGNGTYPPDGLYDCIDQLGIAKNILTVGAVDDIPGGYTVPSDVVMSSFSSWGPADDGRIKPDIVGNGISLYSTDDDSNSDYRTLSGTSMAAPSVAGSLILLQQHYENLHGTGNFMKAATLKALVLHTADEAGYYLGPDYQFGWGLMNTQKAAELISNENGNDTIINELTLTEGGTYQYSFTNSGTEPLQVTIAWTDPPGIPPAPALDPSNVMLVNDLDLQVSESENTFFPWKLNRDYASAAATNTTENDADNVEVVFIENPIINEVYTVTVDHDETLEGGSQDFSIIISPVTKPEMPVYFTNILWSKTFGGSWRDVANSIYETKDGGYVVAGTTASNDWDISGNHGGSDAWVSKLDSAGQIIWSQVYGGSQDDHAESIQQTKDRGYIVAGESYSNDGDVYGNHGDLDFWVFKVDSTGQIIWSKVFGGSGEDRAQSVQQTSDDGYIVGGWTHSSDGDVMGNHGRADFWAIKLDSVGDIEWTNNYGGSHFDYGSVIKQIDDGGYIFTGNSYSNDGDLPGNKGDSDAWVIKLDSAGMIVWSKVYGGLQCESFGSIQQTSDGSLIFAGSTASTDGDLPGNHGGYDAWVVKLNQNGQIKWSQVYGGLQQDGARCLQLTTDEGCVFAGSSSSVNGDIISNHGGRDAWVVKLDSTGQIIWSNVYGGSKSDGAYSIQQSSDMGYIVCGSTESNDGDISENKGENDIWVFKLESDPCYAPTNLTATNFSATSAKLFWIENGSATTWEIMLDTAGFDTTGITPVLVTENPYTWSGLTLETDYDWYIRADCGDGDYSNWVGPSTFRILSEGILWARCYGGSSTDGARSIQQTSDGGYVVAGYTASDDGDVFGYQGYNDMWIVKLTSTGDTIWTKTYGDINNQDAYSIQQTYDGGYVVAGVHNWTDFHPTNFDFWVVKLNNNGDTLWTKTLGGSRNDYARSIQQTSDSGYIVTGYTWSSNGDVQGNHGFTDVWVVKLNSNGNILWSKTYGGSSWDRANSIQQTFDGGYVFAGSSYSNDGDVHGNHGAYDYWVVKLNMNGDTLWTKTLGGSAFERAYSIQQTNDSSYIVAGYTESNNGDVQGNHGENDFWVVKLNNNGNILWSKTIGGPNNDFAYSIKQTYDNGYVVAGSSELTVGNYIDIPGNTDYWIVRLNSIGDTLWTKTLGGSRYENAHSIQQTSDNGYIIAGMTSSNDGDVYGNHGSSDFWIVKLEPELIPGAEPLAHWPMDEGTGTVTEDIVGSNDGTLINGTSWITGIDSYGLQFDGIDDRVDCGSLDALNMGNKDFTISTWVKMETGQSAYPTFVGKGGGASYDPGYWFHYRNGRLKFYISDGTTRINAQSNPVSIIGDNWHHLAVVADRDEEAKFYVDGEEAGTFDISSLSTSEIVSSKSLTLGSWMSSIHCLLNGSMDDTRLYNVALSNSEIGLLAESIYLPLAHWPMDEGTGTFTEDIRGSNDGTLINGTSWITGINSYGLQFDGIDDRVDCGSLDALNMGTKDFTISTWVKMETGQAAYPTLVGKGGGASYDPGYWFHYRNGRLKFYLSDGTTRINAQSDPVGIVGNNWHHLAVVANRDDEARFFVDGEEAGTFDISSLSTSEIVSSKSLTLGSWMSSIHCLLNGNLDDVRLYGFALSETEVNLIYNFYSANKKELVVIETAVTGKLNIYPNPFRRTTTIAFSVDKARRTTLKVYNTMGIEVRRLFEGIAEVDRQYEFTFNAENLPEGIYILHLQSGDRVSVKEKMILLKY